jgi:hypothetical protein
MATMTTTLAPLRERGMAPPAYTLEWEALPQPPRRGVPHAAVAAGEASDLQAAAEAALAELFPALRLRARG